MASRMLSTALRPAASAVIRQTVTAQRGFSASAMSMKHKETHDENYDPEKHKQDLLEKQKLGKGHWKPELATESEEAVKADRTTHEDIITLQKRTKTIAEETSKGGTSMHDGL